MRLLKVPSRSRKCQCRLFGRDSLSRECWHVDHMASRGAEYFLVGIGRKPAFKKAALSPRGVGALVPPAVARHRAFEAARRFRLSGWEPDAPGVWCFGVTGWFGQRLFCRLLRGLRTCLRCCLRPSIQNRRLKFIDSFPNRIKVSLFLDVWRGADGCDSRWACGHVPGRWSSDPRALAKRLEIGWRLCVALWTLEAYLRIRGFALCSGPCWPSRLGSTSCCGCCLAAPGSQHGLHGFGCGCNWHVLHR